MAEVPRAPKTLPLFPDNAMAGAAQYNPNPFDASPVGQPFGANPGGPTPFAWDPSNWGAPTTQMNPPVPPPQQNPFLGGMNSGQGPQMMGAQQGGMPPMQMPQWGGGGGMPQGGMPQQQGLPPMEPPHDMRAHSRGPIARFNDMLKQARDRDPSSFYTMMGALAQGGVTDPQYVNQVAMHLNERREDQGLKREQIDATREAKQGVAEDRESYRIGLQAERLGTKAAKYGITPDEYLPASGEINTWDELHEAAKGANTLIAAKEDQKELDKFIKDRVLSGSLTPDSLKATRFATSQEAQDAVNLVTKRRDEVEARRKRAADDAHEKVLLTEKLMNKRLKSIGDTDNRALMSNLMRINLNKINDIESRLASKERMAAKYKELDVWGLLDQTEAEIGMLEDEANRLYKDSVFMLTNPESAGQVGVGGQGHVVTPGEGKKILGKGEKPPTPADEEDDAALLNSIFGE